MEIKDFALILTKAAVCLNFNLTEQHIAAWYQLFASESKENFSKAMQSVVIEPGRRFFPYPGEVTAALQVIKSGHIEQAGEVWDRLLSYARASLNEAQVLQREASNPAAVSAIKQIEWDKIRYADIHTELHFHKANFVKFYALHNQQKSQTERLDYQDKNVIVIDGSRFKQKLGGIAQ